MHKASSIHKTAHSPISVADHASYAQFIFAAFPPQPISPAKKIGARDKKVDEARKVMRCR